MNFDNMRYNNLYLDNYTLIIIINIFFKIIDYLSQFAIINF
jgi:hypothetical protein